MATPLTIIALQKDFNMLDFYSFLFGFLTAIMMGMMLANAQNNRDD